MAVGVFDPAKHYKCLLYGHNFDKGMSYVELPGHFVANTIDHYDPLTREREFAVFQVDRPKNCEYPFHWAGTYLIPMGALQTNRPMEIEP